MKDIILKLPECGQTNILNINNGQDNSLSVESQIDAILVRSYVAIGDMFYNETTETEEIVDNNDVGLKPVWFPIRTIVFTPSYGEYHRQLMGGFEITVKKDATTTEVVKGTLMGHIQNNKFNISCDNPKVISVKLSIQL